jgi:hemin uptake protein HemP
MTMNQPTNKKRATSPEEIKEVSIEQLLNGQQELNIRHNGERYQLRITGNNKLILTK